MGEELTFQLPIEGDIIEDLSVSLEPGVDASVRQKVNFWQGDACALSNYSL